MDGELIEHKGGCHCGRVRFRVTAPAHLTVLDCNCSICRMVPYLHLIVPPERFTLEQGKDKLATYTFHTGVAQHYFCTTCGVKSFYVPRSHPDDISVNARCLDAGTVTDMTVAPFDDAARETAEAAKRP